MVKLWDFDETMGYLENRMKRHKYREVIKILVLKKHDIL